MTIDDNTMVGNNSIREFLQGKIDNRSVGDVFTLSDLCKPEIANENLSHLGVDFKYLVETKQLKHIAVYNESGVIQYIRTDECTPFTIIKKFGSVR